MLIDLLKQKVGPALRRFQRNHSENSKVSYSQCGEDLILQHLFRALNIGQISYLDIGAHHPSYLSNTYLFYKAGSQGVCIEPDPSLFAKFPRMRPRDMNLNVGIANCEGTLTFYVMNVPTLNTFSKEDAVAASRKGKVKIEKTIEVPVLPVNEVMRRHYPESAPDFVSLDVEGLDIQILRSFDFSKWRPKAFCIETITYSEQREGKKIPEIEKTMLDHNYFVYADTYINTIFVDREVW